MALIYPVSAGEGSPFDLIKFDFFKYQAPYGSGNQGGNTPLNQYNASLSGASQLGSAGLESIYLPMPNDVGSKYGGKWAGQDITTIMSGVLGILQKTDKSKAGAEGIKVETLEAAGNKAGGFFAEQFYRYAANKVNEVPGLGSNLTANDLLSLGTGSIINPNTELLYGGSSLRTHGYTFKLIPQEAGDSTAIRDIVETFRKAILPKRNSGDTTSFAGVATAKNFIGIPDVCNVSFMTSVGGSLVENTFLPKYKTSAITALDVSYVTDGQYQTFSDGAPIGIQLTVAFTELKLLFKEDLDVGFR
jgi:hypothetical protein